MVKFAGFLKRIKKFAGIGLNVLDKVNDVYKNIKPIINPLISTLPGGEYINKGLDFGSKVIDKVAPYQNVFLDSSERSKIKPYVADLKRAGGTIANAAVDAYYSNLENDGLFGKPVN